MDIRITPSRGIRAIGRWLHRVNSRHPWSHNDALHRWIRSRLVRVGVPGAAALDVGCGHGLLARRLGRVYDEVLAIDADPAMVAFARAAAAHLPGVEVAQAAIEDIEGSERFDVITMVAVLHHLDPAVALPAVRRLLRPGGRFLVVGLARLDGPLDALWDLVCVVTNPIIGMLRHPRPVRDAVEPGTPFPVAEPTMSVRQLRELLAEELPGARLTRRLGFRHTIEWTRPDRTR